jgi:benzoyl-CoA-dihydrodiol lyase
VATHAAALVATSPRPSDAIGIVLTALARTIDDDGYHYSFVDVTVDRAARRATLTVRGPQMAEPNALEHIIARGAAWWPLAMARELDDALLLLRTNEPELGLLVLRTEGDAGAVLAADRAMDDHRDQWFVREVRGLLRRTLARLDVTSRSMYAVIDAGSAFAGTLLELALAADRTFMLAGADDAPHITLSAANFGAYPTVGGRTRLEVRFHGHPATVATLRERAGTSYDAEAANAAGLVTLIPDELDWNDELRLAFEERAALSPDALTGLEANLRFAGAETVATKIFGRLSAWQNWVFLRPNATGERGALKCYGTGTKPEFDQERV